MLLHQEHRTRALDFAGDLAVDMSWHAGYAARNDLPGFRHKAFEEIRVFVIDRFHRKVDSAAGHRAVSAPKVGSALRCFWLHG